MEEETTKQSHGPLMLAALAGLGIFLFSEALELGGWDSYKPQGISNTESENYDLKTQLKIFDKRYRFIGRWHNSYAQKENLPSCLTNTSSSLSLDGKLSSN